MRTSIIHWIGVIGEAASHVSQTLRDQYPNVPWPEITAMRNRLFHAYFGVSPDRVWEAVEHDLPELESQVRAILDQLPGEGSSDSD